MAISAAAVTSADITDGNLVLSGTFTWNGNSKNNITITVIVDGNPVSLGTLTNIASGGGGSSTWNLSVPAPSGMTEGTPYTFEIKNDAGDTIFSSGFTVICFYAGTLIATADGEKAVEDLKVGDLVATADGRVLPVRWLGKHVVSRLFTDELRALPVRIKAGALAEGLPRRDLLVSSAHAMHVGGILVNAGALVNGTSIVREYDVPKTLTYYHVEVEEHALLLAEGAASESYVDNVDRSGFTNYDEYVALYGTASVIREMDLPRAKSARQVPDAVRNQIAARAAALGEVAKAA